MDSSLEGLRVLDLSRVLAGPWATQLLGDFGADVVKVERPEKGDDTRAWGPPWLEKDEQRESAYFLACNRNKRSITVDLASKKGQQLIRALAAEADVFVENFRFGTTAKFGIDPESLLALNPRLVYCSISAFDQTSSRRDEPGYDAMVQAAGGLMSITGATDSDGGGPEKVGVAVADLMNGMYSASAILAALRQRDRSGCGQHLEVPLFDSQVAWLANQGMNFLIGNEVPGRLGNAHPNIVPYQEFATRDGQLMLAVGNDQQFARCVGVLGHARLAEDADYSNNAARVANRGSLIPLLQAAFAEKTTAAWLADLKAVGVPAGPINSIADVFQDDYADEVGLVQELPHPYDPALPAVRNPVRFSASPVRYERAPPLLGQHSHEILEQWLGYSSAEIIALEKTGAI